MVLVTLVAFVAFCTLATLVTLAALVVFIAISHGSQQGYALKNWVEGVSDEAFYPALGVTQKKST